MRKISRNTFSTWKTVLSLEQEKRCKADDAVIKRYKDAHNINSIFIAAPGCPAGFSMGMYDECVQHTIENNCKALSTTVSNGSETSKDVFERIPTFNTYLAERPKKYMQILTLKDFETAKKNKKLGVHYTFQSMDAF